MACNPKDNEVAELGDLNIGESYEKNFINVNHFIRIINKLRSNGK